MSTKSKINRDICLFTKYSGNPILTAQNWPYPVNAVINPGAVRLANETVLLVRVEDKQCVSHLTVAYSSDGFTNWRIDSEPLLLAHPRYDVIKGFADPRITWAEEQKQFFITHTCFTNNGLAIGLAITKNFKDVAQLGILLPPMNRDGYIFPRRFRGRFVLIHQTRVNGEVGIYISLSPDLKHWGDRRLLMSIRPSYWDCHSIGLACPLVEVKEGWMTFYYGVQYTERGPIYRIGMALLDLDEPWIVLRRSDDWVLEPSKPYEYVNDVGGVIFPTGVTISKADDSLNMYYGTANCAVAVATAMLSDVVGYVLSCPKVT